MSAIPAPSPPHSPPEQSFFGPPSRHSADRQRGTLRKLQTPQRAQPAYFDSPHDGNPADAPASPSFDKPYQAASNYRRERAVPDSADQPTDIDSQATRRGGVPSSSHGTYAPRGAYSSNMAQQMPRHQSVSSAGRPPRRDSYQGSQYQGSQQTPTRPDAPRGLSFYDMKEQQKRERTGESGPSAPGSVSGREYGDGYSHGIYPPADLRRMPGKGSSLHLPWAMWLNSTAKNHFVATVGEFVGTTMFLFFAFAGTQVANVDTSTSTGTTTNATTGFNPSKLLYIALSFGFSLMVNVWIFFRISGGLFNPAVTLALWTTGAIGAGRALVLFVAQIIGSIAASALVLALFPAELSVQTTLSAGTSIPRGVFIEAFLTAELVFTILMLAKEKHRSTFIAPVGIGLALFIAEMCGVYYTGGSLNPARSIGPAIVGNKWDSLHWIYWVGPFIGVVIAVLFYKFIKALEYEMANPGQDADDWNDPTKNPHHEVREKQRDVTARVLRGLGMEEAAYATQQPLPNPHQWGEPPEVQEAVSQHNSYEPRTSGAGNGNVRPSTGPQSPQADAQDFGRTPSGRNFTTDQ